VGSAGSVIPVLVFDCVALHFRWGQGVNFQSEPPLWGLFALRAFLERLPKVFASFYKKKFELVPESLVVSADDGRLSYSALVILQEEHSVLFSISMFYQSYLSKYQETKGFALF
jgi:hypothetical protein